jgi:DNA-directed RNA polymerase
MTMNAGLVIRSRDLIAYLTVKVLLDSVSRQRTLQSIAIAIGQRLADKARFRKFNDENPALFQVVSRDPQSRTSNLKQKRRVLIHTMRQKSTADWEGWSKVNKLHLGQRLIDIVMSTVGLVSILHTSKGRGKSVIYVQPTAKLVDLISERNGQCELLDPVFVPMVRAPRPPAHCSSAARQAAATAFRSRV